MWLSLYFPTGKYMSHTQVVILMKYKLDKKSHMGTNYTQVSSYDQDDLFSDIGGFMVNMVYTPADCYFSQILHSL